MILLASTPWKINMLNPKSWRFGSDDFPFFIGWFYRFQMVIVQGVTCFTWTKYVKRKTDPQRNPKIFSKRKSELGVKHGSPKNNKKKGHLSEKLQSWFRWVSIWKDIRRQVRTAGNWKSSLSKGKDIIPNLHDLVVQCVYFSGLKLLWWLLAPRLLSNFWVSIVTRRLCSMWTLKDWTTQDVDLQDCVMTHMTPSLVFGP